ncbi:MAG TPA: AI-2E family transporter [Solirubrobacterales bacterium]|jgi:predicted PurR-regulated permease PerM|nr:AI-2E family transporter [Solirubrobacterales bacterium]
MPAGESNTRIILRAVLIVVAVVIVLYVIYQLRRPISWLVIAAFIAIAVSGPVNLLSQHMRRGFAIAIVYLVLILIPIGILALLIPSMVSQGEELANNAPQYAEDVTDFVNRNETLSNLNEDYDITSKIEEEAGKLPDKIPDAAGTLQDIGVGFVNSVFAALTIFILSIFMVASGRYWIERFLETRDPDQTVRMERALDHIGQAVGNYVGGALLQATIAGVTSFILLTILGVPFAAALALVVFFFDLIPLVGATLGAVLVAIVTLFVNFPVALVVWVIYSIAYQQIENYVIQPQIQKRAVSVEPFVVLVAVLFGATLFGIIGALLAIPAAASIQIAIREWMAYRREVVEPPDPTPGTSTA